jgi:hypothetical protein
MANANAAFGFRPVNMDGAAYSGATVRAVFDTAATAAAFVGDAVKIAGTSINGYPTVAQAAAGDPVLGVVTSFEANPVALEDQYRKAATQRFCQIVPVAGDKYFEVQSDDDTTALAITDVGNNAAFIVGSGSTVTGYSGMELDSSGATTTSTLDLQIVALVDRADNLLADTGSTNKNAIVRFNDPQNKPFRTGV